MVLEADEPRRASSSLGAEVAGRVQRDRRARAAEQHQEECGQRIERADETADPGRPSGSTIASRSLAQRDERDDGDRDADERAGGEQQPRRRAARAAAPSASAPMASHAAMRGRDQRERGDRHPAVSGGARLADATAHLTRMPGVGAVVRSEQIDARPVAGRREHHAFGHAEAHLARREVRDHRRQPADQRFGRIRRLDAREYGARLRLADVERQLHELVGAVDGSAATMRAMRRSILVKSSIVIGALSPASSPACAATARRRRPLFRRRRALSPAQPRRLQRPRACFEQRIDLLLIDARDQVLVRIDPRRRLPRVAPRRSRAPGRTGPARRATRRSAIPARG